MATKDYVRRPQKRKSKNTKNKPVPWLRIMLALILIFLFVFALYSLQKAPVSNTETSEEGNTPNKAIVLEEDIEALKSSQNDLNTEKLPEMLAPLPVLGEEEWEYIDSLPEFSVEVDATGPVKSDKEYIMQCGSFRTDERAQELKAKLALQGFESRIIASDGVNGRWYRVVLGPYLSKRNAEKDRHQMRRGNINGCKIW